MPDPLTDDQRTDLRLELDRLREELRSLIADASGLSDTVTLDQAAVGRVSRVDALQQQQMAQAGIRRHEARLQRVERAITRYDDDPERYGDCADCDEPIGIARMRAVPESVFCVRCLAARGG